MEKTNYKMTFGSDESFDIIERIVHGESYDLIYHIVQKDASIFVKRFVPNNDREDVLQEIHLSVYKNLKCFFDNCLDHKHTEKSRNAWLKKIAISKCMTYLKKSNRKEISYEEFEPYLQSDNSGLENKLVQSESVKSIIGKICMQNTTVDKRLAFLLIVTRQAMCSSENGKPSDIADLLNGNTVGSSYKMVISYLEEYLEQDISKVIPRSFVQEVNLAEYEIIQLETKPLTDTTHGIRKKIRKYQLCRKGWK